MSHLQRVLDKKFPLPEGMSSEGHRIFTIWREIFEEGYNAGYEAKADEYASATSGYHSRMEKCLFDKWYDEEAKNVNNFTLLIFKAFVAGDGVNRNKLKIEFPEWFDGMKSF